jgi:hypothetical protein
MSTTGRLMTATELFSLGKMNYETYSLYSVCMKSCRKYEKNIKSSMKGQMHKYLSSDF